MRSLKKFFASATALALISSAFAGVAVQAEVGDVLMSQNFDGDTNWGEPSRTGKASGEYIEVETLAENVTANKPETVSGKVMHYSTAEGENISVAYTMNPALSATAQVYGITFETYLRNASRINGVTATDEEELAKYYYTVGIGESAIDESGNATAKNVFAFKVIGSDVYLISNDMDIDTGIDTGDDGVWVTVDIKADTTTSKLTGTVKTADTETEYTLAGIDFAQKTAGTIKNMFVASQRYDGKHKGHVDNYLDNFVVTEAAPDVYADITIKFVDMDGGKIKDPVTDKGIVGNTYNVPNSYKNAFEAEDTAMYYEYVSGADGITVAESGNEVTLVYELKDKLEYKIFALADVNEAKDLRKGYIIPGETVKAYADYALVYGGSAYGSTIQEISYEPTVEAAYSAVVFDLIENSKAVKYDFEDGVDLFVEAKDADGEGHMTNEVVDSTTDEIVPEGTKAVKLTSSGSGVSKFATAELNVSSITEGYNKVYVNFDSYISGGRMTANLLDSDISSYSDTGLFSIGIKDSRGYRINGTETPAGSGAWVHTSIAVDFAAKTLDYIAWDLQTGEPIVKSSKTIEADGLKSLAFISWSDTTAYVDNVEVIGADKIVMDAEYDFEDGTNPFSNNDHAATAIADGSDEIAESGNVLKFSSDATTGESKQAISLIKLDTAGATKTVINYDSYVDSNNVVFGVASGSAAKDSDLILSHGYKSSKKYYVVNGESGSAYTAANGQWVHTKIMFDAETGSLSYAITSKDRLTAYKSGTIETGLTRIDRLAIASWGESAVGYIDNITVKNTYPKTVGFDSEADMALFAVNDHAELSANGDGNLVFTADSGTGNSTAATATYDISKLTAGKNNIVIKYKSYISSNSRTTVNVGDIFSQGWGSQSYYIVNGATGSDYTGAADTWVDTTLDIDLNKGTCTWTLGFDADGTYKTASKTTKINADSVNSIVIKSTNASDTAMLDDVMVSALGEYKAEPWVLYEATYNEDGVLTTVKVTEKSDPTAVEMPENTATAKSFLWKGMIPYATAD